MRTAEKDKLAVLEQWGGACRRCGYSRCNRALQFHHKDPSQKAGRVTVREAREHPERFELLCANCHFEEHDAQDKARTIRTPCRYCGKPVKMEAARLADGRGKYCSRKCQGLDRINLARSDEERFWSHIEIVGDCWFWTASKSPNGFGQFNAFDENGVRRPQLAHLYSFRLNKGTPPPRKRVRNTCGDKSCANPDHYA